MLLIILHAPLKHSFSSHSSTGKERDAVSIFNTLNKYQKSILMKSFNDALLLSFITRKIDFLFLVVLVCIFFVVGLKHSVGCCNSWLTSYCLVSGGTYLLLNRANGINPSVINNMVRKLFIAFCAIASSKPLNSLMFLRRHKSLMEQSAVKLH